MMRTLMAAIAAMVLLTVAVPARAAETTPGESNYVNAQHSGPNFGLALIGVGIGVGFAGVGGGLGIGAIGGRACEAIARQPEAGQRIFTTMIISAALIEGFTFFAMVVCLLGWLSARAYTPVVP